VSLTSMAPVRVPALRAAVKVDRALLTPAAGLRTAACVALPLLVGILAGHAAAGATAAFGSVYIGVAALIDAHRTPLRTMWLALVGATVSAFVGQVAGGSPVLSLATLALWGFVAGLLTAFGPAGTVIGIQSTLGLLVLGRFPMPAGQALLQCGLVLLGGLLQVVVAALARARDPRAVRRGAVAAAYRQLARLAVSPAVPWPAAAAAGARARSLLPLVSTAPEDEALRQLLDEGLAVRLGLVALADARTRLAAELGEADPLVAGYDAVRRAAGAVLISVADGLDRRPVSDALPALRDAAAALARSSPPTVRLTAPAAASLLHTPGLLEPLTDRLGAAAALVSVAASTARTGLTRPVVPATRRLLQAPAALVRRHAGLQTAAGRHAIRLAVLLPATALLARALPLQHGWWAPLTVLVVLRADYSTTVSRGIARLAGTIAGLVLATLLLFLIPPAGPAVAFFVLVVAWAAYSTFRASYALYAGFLTALVVLMLDVVERQPLAATLGDRLAATTLGGLIAVLAYLLWPTWEHRQVPDRLAALAAATGRYAGVVLAAYAAPADGDDAAAQRAAIEARLARSAVELSVTRAGAEPSRRTPDAPVAVTLRHVDEALLALHVLAAHLPDADRTAVPSAEGFRAASDRSWHALAEALRDGRGTRTRLSAARDALTHGLDPAEPSAALLLAEAGVLTEAADGLAAALKP
jgi:uncharacterized membrane protein YccC